MISATISAWPLTGREAELETIARARRDWGCRGVVITAGAGVGKSRLAREAVTAAERDGAVVEWVQATRSAAAVPLGALAGLLPDAVRSDDTLTLMRLSADALRERGRGRPLVLGLDDAQLLDPVSAALVLHLVTTGAVFVIATVRAGEVCPDAVVSLWKDADARLLHLERLDEDAVSLLVERALGHPLDASAARWITHSSQGNPLYAHELVLGSLGATSLVLEDGVWRLTGRPAVSSSLSELVSQRLAELKDAERAPLELLALAEPLRVAEVAGLTSYDALAETEARGFVTVEATELRLSHPLFGDVLAGRLGKLRARQLRLRLAKVLQRRSPLTSEDALRIVRLLVDAGAEIPSSLLLDAARGARLAGDAKLGVTLAGRALMTGAGLEAAVLLARAQILGNEPEAAARTLAEAEPLALGEPAALEYLRLRVRLLYWTLGRRDEADALLARAGSWSTDEAWRAEVESQRTVQTTAAGNFAHAAAMPASERAQAERLRALTLMFGGRIDEAYAICERIAPQRLPLRDEGEAATIGVGCLAALSGGADWPAFEFWGRRTLLEAVRVNDHQAAGVAAFGLAGVQLARGAYADAHRWCVEAASHLRQSDIFGTLVHVRAFEVGIARFTGADVAAALAAMRGALAGREPLPTQRPVVLRAEGWAAVDRGVRLLGAARELAEHPGFALELAYEAMRSEAAGAVDAVLEFAPRCSFRLASAYASQAIALRDRDPRRLLAAATEFEAIGALRYAMEAAVAAARLSAAAGDIGAARRAATRARALHLGGEAPRLKGLEGVASELTARENQLVELARTGLSNPEIADRLVLSVRTVETHLYRAMHKLGVSDRREL